MAVSSQLRGAGSSSRHICYIFHRRDLARTPQRERSAGDGGLSTPVMKRRRFALKANKAGRGVCTASTNTDVQTPSKASSYFIPNGFWNHLNNGEDLDPSLICSYFCGKKVERRGGSNPRSTAELPPPQRGLMPRPLYAIFMLNLSLFCLRRQIGSGSSRMLNVKVSACCAK